MHRIMDAGSREKTRGRVREFFKVPDNIFISGFKTYQPQNISHHA